jgi:hypothetical protein
MNKRRITPKRVTVSLLAFLILLSSISFAKYGGGSGNADDPYLIAEANQMAAIGLNHADWDKHFKLISDINLAAYTGDTFPLIGRYNNLQDKPFTGVFDGDGHTIFNFTYVSDTITEPVGLFSYFAGEIKNLVLANPCVNVHTTVGAMVGSTPNGSVKAYINDCYVEGGSVTGTGIAGGLVGNFDSLGSIKRCYSTATVNSSGNNVGGLVGYNNWGYIYNSCVSSIVSGYSHVGGLVGGTWVGDAYECFANGSVTGQTCVGGFVGYTSGGVGSYCCYAATQVTVIDANSTGAFLGYHGGIVSSWDFTSCFWDSTLNPSLRGFGNLTDPNEVRGRTTIEMQTRATFTDYGWDFIGFSDDGPDDIWAMPQGGGYPILWWQLDALPPLPFAGGTGEPNDPYLISDAAQLSSIACNPRLMESHFLLANDINLTGVNFYSIGDSERPFKGVFDGNGCTITGLTSTEGLFDRVDGFDAEIKNIVLVDPNIGVANLGSTGSLISTLVTGTVHSCHVRGGFVRGSNYTGGLLGDAHVTYGDPIKKNIFDCTVIGTEIISSGSGSGFCGGIAGALAGEITNCFVETDIAGVMSVGGITGYFTANFFVTGRYKGAVTDCGFKGNLTGIESVGGIAGHMKNGSIIKSFADANIFCTSEYTGGIVGRWSESGLIYCSFSKGTISSSDQYSGGLVGYSYGTILSCYSTCDVNGADYTGGLVGYAKNTTVQSSFAAGKVTGAADTGGLIGYRTGATGDIYNSFWDVNTTGQLTSAGGQGVTTQQMLDPNTFLAAGWDYIGEYVNGGSDEWAQNTGEGYPFLWWQMDPLPPLPPFSGGTGTPQDPYQIANSNQINLIGRNYRLMNASFILTNDIDVIATGVNNIGLDLLPFSGVFDGNNHTISNIDKSLFVCVEGTNALVCNLGIENPDINNTGKGAITTFLAHGTLERCWVDGGIISSYYKVGGLVGNNYLGTLSQCWTSCSVRDNNPSGQYTGGLVGLNAGTINQCYSEADVCGIGYVGGLAGYHSGTISDSYAQGVVSGINYVGGLVGQDSGSVIRCYSTSAVPASGGGLVGLGSSAMDVSYSFWDVNTSGTICSGAGAGRTTQQMKTAETYLCWGQSGLWTINEGIDYPRLTWQNIPGEPITTAGYPGGEGSAENPYLISNAQQLAAAALDSTNKEAHFRLTSDIDLSEYLAGSSSAFSAFDSVFDGNGRSISNLIYNAAKVDNVGLFPTAGKFAQIRDLSLNNICITAVDCNYVGALCGTISSGAQLSNIAINNIHITSTNCNYVGGLIGYVAESVQSDSILVHNVTINPQKGLYTGGIFGRLCAQSTTTNVSADAIDIYATDVDYIGGLVGFNVGALVSCDANCSILADGNYVGGIAGYSTEDMNDCYAACNVTGNDLVGGVAGDNRGASIYHCHATGTVTGNNNVGGLAGRHWYDLSCVIQDSNFTGTVSGNQNVGGLVGYNSDGLIMRSWSDCNVSGVDQVGGFVGLQPYSYDMGFISQCYSKGSVSGVSRVGGFVGNNGGGIVENCYSHSNCSGNNQVAGLIGAHGGFDPSETHIVNCYSTGHVTGDTNTGGLIGLYTSYSENIRNSYWDVQISGQNSSAAGKGRTTSQMYSQDTFAGWSCDSNNVWTIAHNNDYPRLAWENKPGNLIERPIYGGGSGTAVNPYLIYTADQLDIIGAVRCDWDKHFMLMADLDLSEYPDSRFNTIGIYDDSHSPSGSMAFTGVFDGQGHTISNFTLTGTINYEAAGFFGYISGSTSQIKNLGLINPHVNTPISGSTGALIGYINGATVSKCFVRGGTISGGDHVGGLVGRTFNTAGVLISESYSNANIAGDYYVGGLVGFTYSDTSHTGEISNCYSKGDVVGNRYAGGLLGSNGRTNVTKCYSVGHVAASANAGGLIGTSSSGTIAKSFWDVNTSGQATSAGGTGKTTVQMKTKTTFTSVAWDFNSIWTICEGTNYPRLIWAILPADYLCPDGVNFVDYSYLAAHWLRTDYGDCNGIELTGNGRVDLPDFAILANWWGQTACGECGGADYSGDNKVNVADLIILCDNWLLTDYGDVGGAELTGDGIVDLADLLIFSNQWLTGF